MKTANFGLSFVLLRKLLCNISILRRRENSSRVNTNGVGNTQEIFAEIRKEKTMIAAKNQENAYWNKVGSQMEAEEAKEKGVGTHGRERQWF